MGFLVNRDGGIRMDDGIVFKRWCNVPEVGVEYYYTGDNSTRGGGTASVLITFRSKLVSMVEDRCFRTGGYYKCVFENGVKLSINMEASSWVGLYAPAGTVGKHQGAW